MPRMNGARAQMLSGISQDLLQREATERRLEHARHARARKQPLVARGKPGAAEARPPMASEQRLRACELGAHDAPPG